MSKTQIRKKKCKISIRKKVMAPLTGGLLSIIQGGKAKIFKILNI